MGALYDFLRVQVVDKISPPAVPTLTEPLVLGTTAGKACKDELRTYSSTQELQGDWDPSELEYKLASTVLAQGKIVNRPRRVWIWNGTRVDYRLASLETGTIPANNALQWYADRWGEWGERLSLTLTDPGVDTTALSYTLTQELVLGGVYSELTFTQAKTPSEETRGQDIVRVQLIDPEKPNQTLKVEVKNKKGFVPTERIGYRTVFGYYDYTIAISLATDYQENVTTTPAEVVTALTDSNDAAYNALAASLVDVTSSGTEVLTGMDTPEMIPLDVNITLTYSGAAIDTTAWQLAEWVNAETTIGPLFAVSDSGASNGTGLVDALAKTPLLLSNTASSSVELARMLNAMEAYAEDNHLSLPYWMCATTLEDETGDTRELSDAIASRTMVYITMNNEDQSVYEVANLRDTLSSDRTAFGAHTNYTERLDAATVGMFAALTQAFTAGRSGGFTIFWKYLNTISPAKWTSTERALLFGQAPGAPGCFMYAEDFGNRFVAGSWSTSGDFIDWRWKKDYIKLHMTIALYNLFKNNDLTYDNPGIAQLENVVRRKMDQFTKQGLVAAWDNARTKGIYFTEFPRINEVDPVDWARRVYRGKVRFQPAGQIEQVDLTLEAEFLAAGLQPPAIS